MEVKCITIPKEKFSRFDYFRTKSLELRSRYNILLCKTAKKPTLPRFVRLHICKTKRDTEFPIEITDIFGESPNNDLVKENIGKYKSLNCYLNIRNDFESAISLLIVDSKARRELSKLGKSTFHIILIANDDVTKSELAEKLKTDEEINLTVATKETISSDASNLLERISLSPLKKISEDCYSMLQSDRKKYSTKSELLFSAFSSARQNENKCQSVEKTNGLPAAHASNSLQNGFVDPRQTGQMIRLKSQKSSKCTSYSNGNHSHMSYDHELDLKTIYTRSKHRSECQSLSRSLNGKRRKLEFSDEHGLSSEEFRSSDQSNNHADSYECLLEAILALFRMSNVPEKDRPDVPKKSLKITGELRDALFKTCPSIKRMGYRYRTFTISAAKPESLSDETIRDNKIASVLKEHGIENYAIIQCDEHITPLMHVGAKIEARSGTSRTRSRTISNPEIVRGGTLGCFVKANDGKEHCVVSKHVAENCSDVYYVAGNCDTKLGHILPETNRHRPGSLDISAACVEENIDDVERKFKNLKEKHVQGKLYHYNKGEEDKIFGTGQPVYIRGASTNPGKGEITMPFVECGMSTTLIQIEDSILEDGTVQGHFADKGDSGSVVCSDVPGDDVHALSTVVGTSECSATTGRRKYLTIPLSKGLQQLEDETGKKFEL